MSSQSNPNPDFTEEDARQRAAEGAFRTGGRGDTDGWAAQQRPRSHGRNNPISHHKGQEHEVHGGRTAAKQQGLTDSSRGRGRATQNVSQWAQDVLGRTRGMEGEHPDTVAARLDPRRATPLPPDHPAVTKEIKFDRIARLMQPGSNDEVDQRLSSGIEGYDEGQIDNDPDDDWIS